MYAFILHLSACNTHRLFCAGQPFPTALRRRTAPREKRGDCAGGPARRVSPHTAMPLELYCVINSLRIGCFIEAEVPLSFREVAPAAAAGASPGMGWRRAVRRRPWQPRPARAVDVPCSGACGSPLGAADVQCRCAVSDIVARGCATRCACINAALLSMLYAPLFLHDTTVSDRAARPHGPARIWCDIAGGPARRVCGHIAMPL